MYLRRICLLICCVTVVCTIGCSENAVRFPVAGKVLIDGEPVTFGSIQFVPEDGRPVASGIGKDGSFRLAELTVSSESSKPGVPQGKYRIGVSATEIIDEDKGEILRHIPGHYADFRTSELEVEITESKEDMVIELTWEGAEETDEVEGTEGSGDVEETVAAVAEESTDGAVVQEKEAAKEE